MGGVVESVPEKSVHEFIVKDYRGKDVDLSIYKGKVLLIVNVATQCGFTNIQLPQLTELYRKYKDQGFEVLAFPCNQFLKQAPGSSEKTRKVACDRFKAEYPVFRKVCVNGPKTPPLTNSSKQVKSMESLNGLIVSNGTSQNSLSMWMDKLFIDAVQRHPLKRWRDKL